MCPGIWNVPHTTTTPPNPLTSSRRPVWFDSLRNGNGSDTKFVSVFPIGDTDTAAVSHTRRQWGRTAQGGRAESLDELAKINFTKLLRVIPFMICTAHVRCILSGLRKHSLSPSLLPDPGAVLALFSAGYHHCGCGSSWWPVVARPTAGGSSPVQWGQRRRSCRGQWAAAVRRVEVLRLMVLRLLVGDILVAVQRVQRHMVVRGVLVVVRMCMSVVHMLLLLLVWVEIVVRRLLQMLLVLCGWWRDRRGRCSSRRRVGQWQRQWLQAPYAVRRVGCVNVAPPQVVVVYGAGAATVVVQVVVEVSASSSSSRTTGHARTIQSVAVGALVARPPLHVRVCRLNMEFSAWSEGVGGGDATEEQPSCRKRAEKRGMLVRHSCENSRQMLWESTQTEAWYWPKSRTVGSTEMSAFIKNIPIYLVCFY